KKQIIWPLKNVIYEKTRGEPLKPGLMVAHIDGNRDNLHPDNLTTTRYDLHRFQKERKFLFDTFRNVILSKENPDYFKDPADWKEPASLAALEAEKQKRADGISISYNGVGKARKWK
ncbi:HNH endonuclease, partial [Salmonella enterica]|nr:HNH endonuclease [Salmonella enterica]